MWMYYKNLKRDVFVSRVYEGDGILVGDMFVAFYDSVLGVWKGDHLHEFAPPREH